MSMEDLQQALALRSLHSRNRIYVRIMNLTSRDVDIIWINFAGTYVKYDRLSSRSFIDVNTFETHPWIAVDSERKDRMLIDKQFIYMPKTWRECLRNQRPNIAVDAIPKDFDPRLLVVITNPLYSLRYRTLLEVRSYLNNESDVDSLDLPIQLQNDLKLLIVERKRFPNFNPEV